MSHIATCFKKYATFSGRASRAEYWTFWFFIIVISTILLIGGAVMSSMSMLAAHKSGTSWADIHAPLKEITQNTLYFAPFYIFGLAVTIPNIAVSVRRLHDAGFSGWMYALNFIALGIVPFIMYFFASKPGDNEYGPNPYGQ